MFIEQPYFPANKVLIECLILLRLKHPGVLGWFKCVCVGVGLGEGLRRTQSLGVCWAVSEMEEYKWGWTRLTRGDGMHWWGREWTDERGSKLEVAKERTNGRSFVLDCLVVMSFRLKAKQTPSGALAPQADINLKIGNYNQGNKLSLLCLGMTA